MANLNVRGVEERAVRRLKQTAKRRGVSVNRLIVDMLNSGDKAPAAKAASFDDLDALAGTWDRPEAEEFRAAVASFEQIDEDLWR